MYLKIFVSFELFDAANIYFFSLPAIRFLIKIKNLTGKTIFLSIAVIPIDTLPPEYERLKSQLLLPIHKSGC